MNTAKSLAELYNIINQHMGPTEAKNFLSDVIYNVVSELQEKNLPINEEALEALLAKKASDYIDAAKAQVA